ncbi:hypothetical protein RP20_CCG007739 [Aedes albopictus]|nr:hypothetical protein RP20_CCG007739 [Aedes albopictus]
MMTSIQEAVHKHQVNQRRAQFAASGSTEMLRPKKAARKSSKIRSLAHRSHRDPQLPFKQFQTNPVSVSECTVKPPRARSGCCCCMPSEPEAENNLPLRVRLLAFLDYRKRNDDGDDDDYGSKQNSESWQWSLPGVK